MYLSNFLGGCCCSCEPYLHSSNETPKFWGGIFFCLTKFSQSLLEFVYIICIYFQNIRYETKVNRSSRPELFIGKGVLKICCKVTGEHTCQSAISIKLLCNFIEITLWHGYSSVNLLHVFRTSLPKNISGGVASELKW